jgi:hypothetical protein
LQNQANRLRFLADEKELLRIVLPYLLNPYIILGILGFFSVLIPIIEEAGKPIGVWLGANFIMTPQQGFALGALSGAAYALVESLGNSASAAGMWQTLITARVGTDVVHILNSALMGWALVDAWRNRKFLKLGLIYLVVILIHGLWNAASLSYGVGSLSDSAPGMPTWMGMLSTLSIGIMIALTVSMLIVMAVMNYKLRKSSIPVGIEVTEVVRPETE